MFDIANILQPETIDEALKMLADTPDIKIIAGGTDVLITMHHGNFEGAQLLSIRNIKGMSDINILPDGTITIGAMVSFSQLYRNEIINRYIPVLGEAVMNIGGPQIRNMGTIGGNICNGAVSADSAPTLFAYNALLKINSNIGERMVPMVDFYEGPGKVKLGHGEILSAIHISKANYDAMYGRYIKYCNRKALDIAMLGVSVLCNISYGKFNDLRIALGVAAPTPIRCHEAEDYAKGQDVTSVVIDEIGRYALKASKARDSWRASKAYREHLIETLTVRAIKEAIIRGGGEYIE